MDIEETIRVHERVKNWLMPHGIALATSVLLEPNDAKECLQFLRNAPVHSQILSKFTQDFLQLGKQLAPGGVFDYAEKNKPNLELITKFSGIAAFSLEPLYKLPVATEKDLEDALAGRKPAIDREAANDFVSLGVPIDFKERDAWMNHIGSVYDLLNRKSQKERQEAGRLDSIAVYRKLAGLSEQYNDNAAFLWALATSPDTLKAAFALSIFIGKKCIILTPDHLPVLVNALYDRLDNTLQECRAAQEDAQRAAELQKRIAELEEDRATLRQRCAHNENKIADDAKTIAELSGRKDPAVPELQAKLVQAQADIELWEGLAQNEEQQRKALEQQVVEEQKLSRMLARRLAKAVTHDVPLSEIANSTGITIHASPDFSERYRKVLHYYSDPDLASRGLTFPDVLDFLIAHLCHRIKDGGRSIIIPELEYMKQVECYFYKKNDLPGKLTRLFFTTNFADRLTVFDAITPGEHDEKIQKDSGRYKAIMANRVSYTFDPATHAVLKSSVRELLK